MKQTTVYDCSVIELQKHSHEKGNITIVCNSYNIPFDVNRVYYLYDVPSGKSRGGHAHYKLKQLIIAASGSFDVMLDDGSLKRRISLNRPNLGLLVAPGLWRELDNFSGGSVCLVLASLPYEEADYIRNYEDFIKYKTK